MNWILGLPPSWRFFGLFLLGAAVGVALNVAIQRLRWRQSAASPWLPDPRRASRASWLDRVPILGWFFWRRQQALYGRGFWLRPLMIELTTGLLFAALYWWEAVELRLLLELPTFAVRALPPRVWPAPGGWIVAVHLTLASHLILVALMIAASFIDIDDRLIPDSVTIPGTLAGLALAAIVPWSLLPQAVFAVGPNQFPVIDFLKLSSPNPWPARLEGSPNLATLAIGVGCYWAWCLALTPRHWRTRHGYTRAWRILTARWLREPITWLALLLGLLGTPLVALVWWIGGPYWAGLFTALVGMAAGGGIVWSVRIIGAVTLRREAMGFGDVTLLAMIGAYLGWQAAVLIFFVAPLFALLIGLANWIIRGQHDIPYGPFLCLAALALIIRWPDFWQWASPFFGLGWLVPAVLVFCMGLMALLLAGMRFLSTLRYGGPVR